MENMKKSVVIGATGTIGKGIAHLLKSEGHDVIAASRKSKNPIDIDQPESIKRFFQNHRDLDYIVCAAGNANFGSLAELTDDQIDLGIKSKLLGQINVVRHGLPVLKPNGAIILTGGILAHQPMPGSAAISMVNAGLEGFVKAAALELSEGRRILIAHPPFLKETAEAIGMPSEELPTSPVVAEYYLKGLEGSENGVAIYVE